MVFWASLMRLYQMSNYGKTDFSEEDFEGLTDRIRLRVSSFVKVILDN